MKKLFLFVTLVSVVSFSFGQSEKYQKAMEQNLASLNSAKTPEDLLAASASFERIANAEKNQWLPYYYAALAQIFRGFGVPNDKKDEVATQADTFLAKAEAMESKSAEIFIAKNMASTIHMLVDPQTRWQTYGPQGAQALAAAKQLEENNPRIYYLEGQGIFGTPEQFGGGKQKAKPLFEKSVALFASYKPVNNLHPNWGKEQAEEMLKKCSE